MRDSKWLILCCSEALSRTLFETLSVSLTGILTIFASDLKIRRKIDY